MDGPDTGDQGNQVLLEEDKTQKECTLLQEVDSDWRPEMEFLDISLTNDFSIFLHAVHSPFYCRILTKTIHFSVL